MSATYDDLLVWAYVGEVWGERMLERMLQDDTFSDERDHLRLLLALESRTRQSLEAVVSARGLSADTSTALQEADDYADGLARNQDWDAFMRETLEIATSALPKFQQMCDLGPEAEKGALNETVQHEEAVIRYSSARLAGQPDVAAEAVSNHLATWAHGPVTSP